MAMLPMQSNIKTEWQTYILPIQTLKQGGDLMAMLPMQSNIKIQWQTYMLPIQSNIKTQWQTYGHVAHAK